MGRCTWAALVHCSEFSPLRYLSVRRVPVARDNSPPHHRCGGGPLLREGGFQRHQSFGLLEVGPACRGVCVLRATRATSPIRGTITAAITAGCCGSSPEVRLCAVTGGDARCIQASHHDVHGAGRGSPDNPAGAWLRRRLFSCYPLVWQSSNPRTAQALFWDRCVE